MQRSLTTLKLRQTNLPVFVPVLNKPDFEAVTIQELFYEVEAPDSVNINAYVVDIHECPEDAVCVLPDRIVVTENLPPEVTY